MLTGVGWGYLYCMQWWDDEVLCVTCMEGTGGWYHEKARLLWYGSVCWWLLCSKTVRARGNES